MPRYVFKFRDEGFAKDCVNLRIKSGTRAVDPQSEHVLDAHVYGDYSACLVSTSIEEQRNEYYKLQLLESDCVRNSCWLLQSYGEIGAATFTCCETEMTITEAEEKFEEIFQRLTGNSWKRKSEFKAIPGRMNNLEIIYTPNVVDDSRACRLARPLEKLMDWLVRSRSMELPPSQVRDTKMWPLGVLADSQIEKARGILRELLENIDEPRVGVAESLTNAYYSTFPRKLKSGSLRSLDTVVAIRAEQAFLDALPRTTPEFSPLDAFYAELSTVIEPLNTRHAFHHLILASVRNTGSVEVEDIFQLKRPGEEQRYEPFKDFANRKLLWHGSALENIYPILSQGLIISGVARSSGLFGAGIYFADMVAKSIPYCRVVSKGDTSYGFLLLCEVALGQLDERVSPCQSPPAQGCDSVFVRGKTVPDPKGNLKSTADGIVFATGRGGTTRSSRYLPLQYNEYVVYNEAQVQMKYLVKFRFQKQTRST